MDYPMIIIVYVISFVINYLFIRKTESNPDLFDFVMVVTPFLNSIITILILICGVNELYGKENNFTRKFFGVKRKG